MMNVTRLRSIPRSWLLLVSIACCCVSTFGCSLCCSPYDYDYGTFGTRTPRTDMRHGRVGSVFSDPALRGQTTSDQLDVIEYADEGSEEMMLEEGETILESDS